MSDSPRHDHPHTIARNARYGIWLFLVYVLFYGGFVLLSAFWPNVMGSRIGGVNLAIVYGMGLIVLAFVLALVYMFLTRAIGGDDGDGSGGKGDRSNGSAEGRA